MRLTEKTVAAIKPGSARAVVWDDRLKGFGIRITPNGAKSYIAKTRIGRAQRMVTLGPVDDTLGVEKARRRAAEAIEQARNGIDPTAAKREARQAMTVAELCEAYMAAARAGQVSTRFHRPKSPSTVAIDEGRISRHIGPLIGSIVAKNLRRADVQRMADAIGQGKTAGTFKTKARGKAVVTGGTGTAARVVELLGGIWSWAEKREHVSGASPTRGVDRVRGDAKDRVLSSDELKALGEACAANDGPAAFAVRLLALTGCRRDEIVRLRWDAIDQSGTCLHLTKTKTGRSTRPLAKAAADILAAIPRCSEWVFPNRGANGPADLKSSIATLFDAAGLHDARSHDLRRTFGTRAADLGYGDATIAELLGHARRGVTETHYVRRSDPVLVAAANAVAVKIAAAMSGEEQQRGSDRAQKSPVAKGAEVIRLRG